MIGKDSRPAERAEAAKIARSYDDERGGQAEVIVAEVRAIWSGRSNCD